MNYSEQDLPILTDIIKADAIVSHTDQVIKEKNEQSLYQNTQADLETLFAKENFNLFESSEEIYPDSKLPPLENTIQNKIEEEYLSIEHINFIEEPDLVLKKINNITEQLQILNHTGSNAASNTVDDINFNAPIADLGIKSPEMKSQYNKTEYLDIYLGSFHAYLVSIMNEYPDNSIQSFVLKEIISHMPKLSSNYLEYLCKDIDLLYQEQTENMGFSEDISNKSQALLYEAYQKSRLILLNISDNDLLYNYFSRVGKILKRIAS